MTNYEELLRALVTPLVINQSDVTITTIETSDGFIDISVNVAESDLGRVIGRGGKIANAIRTICYAGASKDGVKVRINIDEKK